MSVFNNGSTVIYKFVLRLVVRLVQKCRLRARLEILHHWWYHSLINCLHQMIIWLFLQIKFCVTFSLESRLVSFPYLLSSIRIEMNDHGILIFIWSICVVKLIIGSLIDHILVFVLIGVLLSYQAVSCIVFLLFMFFW